MHLLNIDKILKISIKIKLWKVNWRKKKWLKKKKII